MEDALDRFSSQQTCHEEYAPICSNSPVSHGHLGKVGLAQNSLPNFTNPEDEIDSLRCVNRCERTQAGFLKEKKKKSEIQGKESDIDAVNPASHMGTNRDARDKARLTAYRGRPINHPSIAAEAGGSAAAASLSAGIRDAADTGCGAGWHPRRGCGSGW